MIHARSLRATGRRCLALVAVVATVVAGTQVPASGGTRHRPVPAVILAHSAELYPEGVAWDPTRQAFLVGSARQGNLSVVRLDGTVRELAPSLGLVSTLGVKVDLPRRRIAVAYSDYWVRQSLPVEQPPTSGVAIFDLFTGSLVKRVDLSRGSAPTFANDLAIDRFGNIYVSDSVSSTIQRIDLAGRVTDLVTDARFGSPTIGLNGIVWHPDGYLLIMRHDSSALFRVTLGARVRVDQVALPVTLIGVDGLVLRPDGKLVAVTNSIGRVAGVIGGVDAVTTLRSDDGWRSVRLVSRTEPWPQDGPTTATVTPFGTFVLSGNVRVLMTGGTSDEIVIRNAG